KVVPHGVSVEDAVMLCTWREVYGAFEDFNLKKGDNIIIYGAGPVGLSFVKFGCLLGLNEIYCVDRNQGKLEKAKEMGATGIFKADSSELRKFLEAHRRPYRHYVDKKEHTFDAVVDAIGSQEVINGALPVIKMGGSICVYGVIDTPALRVNRDNGPYNFNLLVHQWPTRSRESAAQEPLVEWIRAGKLSHKEFVSVEFPIREAAKAFENSKAAKPIKTLFRY